MIRDGPPLRFLPDFLRDSDPPENAPPTALLSSRETRREPI